MQIENAAPFVDNVRRGIVFMTVSVFTMALTDAIVKLVSADMSVWQVFMLRSLFALPVLVALARLNGIAFRFQHLGWSILRNAFLVLCWVSIYASLPFLNFSLVSAIVYTAPIMVILLSALFLGEPISWKQWLGVFLGFAGVLVILRPGTSAFSWFTLLPLAGAAFYALSMVTTRGKCRGEEALALSILIQIMFGTLGLVMLLGVASIDIDVSLAEAYPFILTSWHDIGLYHWAIVATIGILAALIFMGVARAYQITPPAILAVFDYIYLVSAALWAFVFFGEVPDQFTIIGIVMIVGAGIMVAVPPKKRKLATIAPSNIQPQ